MTGSGGQLLRRSGHDISAAARCKSPRASPPGSKVAFERRRVQQRAPGSDLQARFPPDRDGVPTAAAAPLFLQVRPAGVQPLPPASSANQSCDPDLSPSS